MSQPSPERLRFMFFTSFAPAGPPGMAWHHPKAVNFNYMNLADWAKLAQALEAAKFDGIFWADHSGVHDTYQGSWATSVREAVQFPLGDPLLLTAALTSATTNLGFAFSANVIQDHPYAFARRLSTLDHLTKGRIAWNIVTSFQKSAWLNLGFDEVGTHASRYARAEEYVTVIYKLLEGSWEDDAVLRDVEHRIYADPSKVHEISHDANTSISTASTPMSRRPSVCLCFFKRAHRQMDVTSRRRTPKRSLLPPITRVAFAQWLTI